jgi:hypothetical protein
MEESSRFRIHKTLSSKTFACAAKFIMPSQIVVLPSKSRRVNLGQCWPSDGSRNEMNATTLDLRSFGCAQVAVSAGLFLALQG